ncbi:MAG: hypothetical protein AAF441_05330 [Pseudomonadota bacterium]
MNGNDIANQAVSAAGGGGAAGGAGNQALEDAFNYAIAEAQQTLTISTKKGADLYALKQRPQ